MTERPIDTDMPGLRPISFSPEGDGVLFLDGDGVARILRHTWQEADEPVTLLIQVGDGSSCQFKPWPAQDGQVEARYPEVYSAPGLYVVNQRVGIASAIYSYARQLLATRQIKIAPSGNQMPDGMESWSSLDPEIEWESVALTGGYKPMKGSTK